MNQTVKTLLDALSAARVPAQPEEYDIHALLSEAFAGAGLEVEHEYRLAPRCRVDFCFNRIGIEVKKGRPNARTLRAQLARYLETGALDALIVVTQRYVPLPDTIGGKRVYLCTLDRLWGVALP